MKAAQGLLDSQFGEVANKPVGIEEVGVDDNALNVTDVLVVFESSLQQASLLTQIGDSWTVVVSEHIVAQNGVGDLRSVHEVHLQESGLEGSFLGLVVLESIEEERCGLLDHVLTHEDVDDLRDA